MSTITIKYKQECPQCGHTRIQGMAYTDFIYGSAGEVICSKCQMRYPVSMTIIKERCSFINLKDPRNESVKEKK